jgi:outer membrane protein
MGRMSRLALVAGSSTLLLWTGFSASAAESFKVGVVDQKIVLDKTRAGKRAMEELKEFTASRQRIISADDQELKAMDEALKSQESSLSESAKREKAEQFRTKLEGYQKRVQDFNREIQDRQRRAADDFQKKIEEATASVAERGGYSLVFEKGSEDTLKIILYNQTAIDLTDLVIKEFDRRHK